MLREHRQPLEFIPVIKIAVPGLEAVDASSHCIKTPIKLGGCNQLKIPCRQNAHGIHSDIGR